ncbi:hypothetical protein J3F83DRAFT_66727 [Trichoderma novae-zelandiae]
MFWGWKRWRCFLCYGASVVASDVVYMCVVSGMRVLLASDDGGHVSMFLGSEGEDGRTVRPCVGEVGIVTCNTKDRSICCLVKPVTRVCLASLASHVSSHHGSYSVQSRSQPIVCPGKIYLPWTTV